MGWAIFWAIVGMPSVPRCIRLAIDDDRSSRTRIGFLNLGTEKATDLFGSGHFGLGPDTSGQFFESRFFMPTPSTTPQGAPGRLVGP